MRHVVDQVIITCFDLETVQLLQDTQTCPKYVL